MTVRDVWETNFVFRVVMTTIATVGAAAVIGGVAMYAQVRSNTDLLRELRRDIQAIHTDYGERLRYLERSRRGVLPGEP